MRLHVAMAGPIAGQDIRAFLDLGSFDAVPSGYPGAPLTSVLIGELLRRGHQVTALTTDSQLPLGSAPVRLRGPNLEFVVCPARSRAWRFSGRVPGRALDFFAHERAAMAAVLRQVEPDIVHAHWTYEFALAALATEFPHLITCHDSPLAVLRFTRSPYRALRYLMAKQVFAKGRNFTTVSGYMTTELARWLPVAPIVIPNPVSQQVLRLGRQRARPPTRRVAMVCNGWDRLKNPQAGMLGFAAFKKDCPQAQLHLFGAGFGPGETAQCWAQDQRIDTDMHFHGRVAHAELIAKLSETDLLLHPSREESFGVVMAEAMALGMPVVAGATSGAAPWVLGAVAARSPCAVLVDVGSVASIAAGLSEALDVQYPNKSLAAIERARAMFAPDQVAGAYERCYADVLRGKPGATAASGPAQNHAGFQQGVVL